MMDSFAHQVEVLLHQSPHWQAELKQRLTCALSGGELKLSDGMRKQMIQRLALLEGLSAQSHVAELTAPWDETSPAIHMLLDEMLGVRHAQNILGEQLLLVEGEGAPLAIPVTMEGARIPLSAGLPLEEGWHAHFLPDAMGEAPLLQIDDEKTSVISTQEYIQVTLEVKGKGRLRVTRRYDASACMLVSGEELPGLSLEPALRLPAKAWKRYTIKCQHRPDFRGEAWQRGAWVDIPDGEKVLSDFPAALRLTCQQEGAACTNLFFLRHKVMDIVPKGSAVVGVDLGSTAAGVLVRIGTEAVPVVLRGGAEPLMGMNAPGISSGEAGPLFDMSWSPEGRLMSADLTLADVLGDGADLCQRELLWGISADRRQVLTAYLELLLRKISWFVALMGGEDVVWRFSVPALLPLPRRDELLAMLEPMVHQVAEETGLPLTYGMSPCLMTLDVDALGYVYRGEEKGGHRGSVLMADVGGHGLSASLWLRGMSKRIVGFTLPMGIRTLLLQWLILHPDTLLEDRHVLGEDQEDLQETEQAMALLRRSTGSLSGLEQAQGMMDAYLGERVHTLLRAGEAGNQGEDGTVMQALILMYFSWLFTMVGLMMESASSDALLNDRLPPKLTVRVCGRGAQLMAALPPDAQERVHGFLRLPGISTNPVAIMEVTHSAFPKREAAMGLAMMTQVEMETERLTHVLSSPQQFQRDMAEGLMETMRSFLLHFVRQFPGFMDLVLPGWVKQDPRLALSEEAVQAIRRWAVSTAAQGGESLQWMECVSTGLSFLLEAHGRG